MATKKVLFRQTFENVPRVINWFPGHMRKAMRLLDDELKTVNLFIEVRDARIPITSQNQDLINVLPQQMKRIIVYNKIDLANQKKSIEIIKKLRA